VNEQLLNGAACLKSDCLQDNCHKEAQKAQKSAELICAFCASLWLKYF